MSAGSNFSGANPKVAAILETLTPVRQAKTNFLSIYVCLSTYCREAGKRVRGGSDHPMF
jgi:hypothetical protein